NPHGENHAVFFAFAPRENPKIAIAVFVENAGYGGTWAGPIVNMLVEKYLKDTISLPQYIQDRIYDANFLPEPKVEKKEEVKKATTKKRNTQQTQLIASRREFYVHHSEIKRGHE